MKRRFFLWLTSSLLVFPSNAWAQLPPNADPIAIFRELVKALTEANGLISMLPGVFKHLTDKRERQRLLDISRRTVFLITTRNIPTSEIIDMYLATHKSFNSEENFVPFATTWQEVVSSLNETLSYVYELLEDVQSEKGGFVLEPEYLELSKTLTSRTSLLKKLSGLPEPSTPEEYELLHLANSKYKLLISNTEELVGGLNAYIKGKE